MIAWLSRLMRLAIFRRRHSQILWPKAMFAGRGTKVAVTGGGTLRSGENLDLVNLADILVKFNTLLTGRNTNIEIGAVISCREAIFIGDNALIAEHVTIRDQDHNFRHAFVTVQAGFTTATIAIGDNVWIDMKATVTKGVTVGDNVVMDANSVVTPDITSNSVAVGVPARVVNLIGGNA